ncbi:MFS transporter [Kitasatospora sp. NPDC004669]|uniref:MFS transporter n=1 Tax=Kitasatospora sp. NPDC004669 TaxID=3154555 RepID=UPI0033AC9F7D
MLTATETTTPTPLSASAVERTGFRAVLSIRYVTPLLLGTLVGRLPTAMAPIALLLAVRAAGGGIVLGATLAACYGLAAALGQPALGRLVDRTFLAPVAASAAGLSSAALTALALTDPARHPLRAGALAIVAGLATAPLESGLRALWPRLVPDPAQQRAAYTLDSTSQEIVFVAGPVTATALAQTIAPAAALLACAIVGAVGALAVAACPPSYRWRPERHPVHWLGPLRSRGLLLTLAAMGFLGMALGSVPVLALDMAARLHTGWLTGLLPGAFAAGSLLGGILYARRTWPGRTAHHLIATSAGFAAGFLPLLTAPSPGAAVALVLVPGLFLAPMLTAAFVLADRLAPAGTATEAAAWMVAVAGIGQATGTCLTGNLTTSGPLTTAVVPALAAATTACLLSAGRRLLLSPS